MKGLFRNKTSAILLIIAFVAASIAFNYSAGVDINKELEPKDALKYQYTHEATIWIAPQTGVEIGVNEIVNDISYFLDTIPKLKDCTITLVDIAPFADYSFTNYTADIFIAGEMPKYDFVKGGYPSEKMLTEGQKCVVLGKNISRETYSRDGNDYITLEGEEYLVTGYISAEMTRILDNKIILFNGCIGDNLLKSLYNYYISGMMFVLIESDVYDSGYICKNIQTFLDKLSMERYQHALITTRYEKRYSTAVKAPEYKTFAQIIYIFCIVMTFFVMEYWMMQRRDELAIRKAFGYSNIKLFGMVVLETLAAIIMALVFSEIIIIIIDYYGNGIPIFNENQAYYRFVSGVLYGIFTLCLACIYPFYSLIKHNPITLMCTNRE